MIDMDVILFRAKSSAIDRHLFGSSVDIVMSCPAEEEVMSFIHDKFANSGLNTNKVSLPLATRIQQSW